MYVGVCSALKIMFHRRTYDEAMLLLAYDAECVIISHIVHALYLTSRSCLSKMYTIPCDASSLGCAEVESSPCFDPPCLSLKARRRCVLRVREHVREREKERELLTQRRSGEEYTR